jgi:hypothetical protein
MTENEKALFMAVGSLGRIVSEMMNTQAETNRVLADKLPNVSGVAQAALRETADALDLDAQKYKDSAQKILDSVPK